MSASNNNSDSLSHDSVAHFSPFSTTFSVHSENTSDEPPDLGSFGSVFRALSSFNSATPYASTSTASPLLNLSDADSLTNHSTVWDHVPVRSYLLSDQEENLIGLDSSEDEFSNSEDDDRLVGITDPPTLGDLESALRYLAIEREKLDAQVQAREASLQQEQHSGDKLHSLSPRRRRRRRRKNPKSRLTKADTVAPTPELSYSSAELSSSPDTRSHTAGISTMLRLSQSRSTPNLLAPDHSLDPTLSDLKRLAVKLTQDFQADKEGLMSVPKLSTDPLTNQIFGDPRGPPPPMGDDAPLIHVFIDHSNILIGFLSYLRRNHLPKGKAGKLHISHASLCLVLERGRKVSRRVMVASSPLYQSMELAEQLGYEVRVFARVPDSGDGMDRVSKYKNRHSMLNMFNPVQSRDADSSPARPSVNNISHVRTSSASAAVTAPLPSALIAPTVGNTGRVRYREQGVDELLQLKLHQAMVETDAPPDGSTIVLATGDGNIGQFNEEGFVGCVRTALKKGWKVELFAWREGLSRAWLREFGSSEWKDKFQIIGLERYGDDLLFR